MPRLKLFTMRITDPELVRMRQLARYRRESVAEMMRALLDTEEARQKFNEATTPEAIRVWLLEEDEATE